MVSRLIRTRSGIVAMPPELKRGQAQELEREELDALLKAAGMHSFGGRGNRPAEGESPEQHSEEHDAPPGEVDGNRIDYAPSSEPAFEEVDGNRAPPEPARSVHLGGQGGRPNRRGRRGRRGRGGRGGRSGPNQGQGPAV